MGRHADTSAPRRLPRIHPRILIAAVVVLVLAVGGGVWLAVRSGGGAAGCTPTAVRVTVAPELATTAHDLLAEPVATKDGGCAQARVTAQRPVETVGSLGALGGSSLPEVWVPDSSLWAARAQQAGLSSAGSMAGSPVVLATSRAAVGRLGWDATPPTWAQAFASGHPIAVPDLAASAEGIAALAAVHSSLGGGTQADNAVVAAVLAAQRGPSVSPQDALAAGTEGDADAPLVPVTEQSVWAADHGHPDAKLVAVYPSEGSPWLDYPVLRVGSPTGRAEAAVDAVVARLTSAAARSAVAHAGFRDPKGAPPPDAGPATGIQEKAPGMLPLDPAAVQQLTARLASLAKPSRILAVFDVSTSMKAPVGDGTRVTLARDAAKSALALVPDNSAAGLWDFAYHLQGDQDWTELVPVRQLGTQVDGTTQRAVLAKQLDTLPSRLAPGGTGLYDTTLAAVRAARANYDPTAVNSVLLVTDGANDDDPAGLQLSQLLQTLQSEADPTRPVKVIAVGLGPDADMAALKQIASATGGAAYPAVDPRDLQTVLFDALRQRENAG